MWRARFEVPEFRRCCFCIPLRYGLLAWAYIKLVVIVFAALFLTSETVKEFSYRMDRGFQGYMLIPLVLDIAVFADILFTILFIVSGHMKNRKGLRIYYYYSLVMLCIYIVGFVAIIANQLISFGPYLTRFWYWMYLVQNILIMSMALVMHTYIVLLVRSEVTKLENPNNNFRFVNNEAESTRVDKSDGNAILREETEDTESRTEDLGEYTY